ncbi:MAG: CHAT domain-containing protein [Chthoniobacteraceae bacterium]
MVACASAAGTRPAPGQTRAEAARALAERGQFESAVEEWRRAKREFARAKDADGETGALLGEASALAALGHHKFALSALAAAGELADRAHSRKRQAEVKAARGRTNIFSRQADQSEDLLRDALKMARADKNDALAASALDGLAIVLAAQDKYLDAITAWDQAIDLSDRATAVRVRLNKATAALKAAAFPDALRWAGEVAKGAEALPDGHGKAFAFMGAAEIFRRLFIEAPEHDNALRLRAFNLHKAAEKVAVQIDDRRALSYALGYQGALYEFEGNHAAALPLTRRALAIAQQIQSADALHRWQWQVARLLGKTGERDAAIEAYRRAVRTLEGIRNDVAIRSGNRNARSSFREAVGALYTELADLLLQRATAVTDGAEIQALLREARGTAELLKAAELEDYFQDDCVMLLKSKTRTVETISVKAALIYIVPLPDRTELLVSLPPPPVKQGAEPVPGRIERFTTRVGEAELTTVLRSFRLNLENRTTNEFLEQAQQLYAWLIKPLEPLMAAHRFDTMVFVPDGALRTIPMAALHDGERFLIEKYAVAVTPGLELMESKQAANVAGRLMIAGISESVQDFPPLPNVPGELSAIGKLYNERESLLDSEGIKASIEGKFGEVPFTIVHIASHGHIDSDIRKSFVLTYDGRLTLDDLERLIRPGQLADKPLELLTLSACQTAAGDDRAALGLAGVAVKAGARAAFATLWFVNDQASAQVVVDFYTELKSKPDRTKAQALQAAQTRLLRDERFQHPCYWAPYLIIGNWL